jgi:F-type H+-transporting ATPase subunit epsilon
MAETFHFELVSPERQLVSADLAEVIIPGQEGDFAALANHSRLVAQIRPGILTTKTERGEEKQFFLRGGFADVGPGETAVIAEYAVPLEDFNSAMLTDEIALAQAALEEARDDASRYAAGDRLERLQSLQPRIGR